MIFQKVIGTSNLFQHKYFVNKKNQYILNIKIK